jgi:hypothetical protein
VTQFRCSVIHLLALALFTVFCIGVAAAAGTGGGNFGASIWGGSWNAYCYDRTFSGTWNASVSESNWKFSGNFYIWGGRQCSGSLSGSQAGDTLNWDITGSECRGNGTGSVSGRTVSGEFVGIGSYCTGSFSGNCTSNCPASCPSDQTPCGSSCCTSGQTCVNGICQATCSNNSLLCGSICCNSGLVCLSPGVCGCPAGQTECSGACRDTKNDPSNCGNCSIQCSQGKACQNGKCACPSGETECESGCCSLANQSLPQNQPSTNPLDNICFVGGIASFLSGIWNWLMKLL